MLSYANGPINAAYVVEVKSHAREESIAQMNELLVRSRQFFPSMATSGSSGSSQLSISRSSFASGRCEKASTSPASMIRSSSSTSLRIFSRSRIDRPRIAARRPDDLAAFAERLGEPSLCDEGGCRQRNGDAYCATSETRVERPALPGCGRHDASPKGDANGRVESAALGFLMDRAPW